MDEQIKDWLINWFKENTDLNIEDINPNDNYLEKEWIDSLKFIWLITEIEEHFQIEFSNDDFEDRNFSTIKGLTQRILQLKG